MDIGGYRVAFATEKCDFAMASVMPVVILLKLFMCHLLSSIPIIDIKKISDLLDQFEKNDFPWVIDQIVGEWENEVQTVNQVFVEDVHGGKSNKKSLTGDYYSHMHMHSDNL